MLHKFPGSGPFDPLGTSPRKCRFEIPSDMPCPNILVYLAKKGREHPAPSPTVQLRPMKGVGRRLHPFRQPLIPSAPHTPHPPPPASGPWHLPASPLLSLYPPYATPRSPVSKVPKVKKPKEMGRVTSTTQALITKNSTGEGDCSAGGWAMVGIL